MSRKRASLKKKYYINFLCMIVIPVLVIFVAAIGVVNRVVRSAALSNIRSAQESMRDVLESDVKEASIQLSHMVYIDDGIFMDLARQSDTNYVARRNHVIDQMDEMFQIAAAPKQDILSMKIYFKDGKSTYVKDDLKRSSDEVKESDWYEKAREIKNTVMIGTYDTSSVPLMYTRQRKWEFIIIAALSPDRTVDRSERIEMVTLFYRSDIGDLIRKLEKENTIGTTIITDADDNIIYQGHAGDEEIWYLKQMGDGEKEVSDQRVKKYEAENKTIKYTYATTPIDDTGWQIINFIPSGDLTKRINQIALYMFVVLIIMFLLFYYFSRYFLRNILNPVHNLVEGMGEVRDSNFDVHIEPEGQHEIREMIHSFNQMVRMLKNSIQEKELAQERKHEAEVRALQSQINPHFLVNALNSIRFMAQVSKYEGIQKMAEALMRIVTCSFRSNISFYSLREEIEVLDSYLYLMKIRYSEGFDVEYDIDESCLEFQVPRLILQPLVENAIVHGFSEDEIGHLKITAQSIEERLHLRIWDDGCGMSEDQVQQILNGRIREKNDNTSIGMENVITRLKLNFGDSCDIQIHSKTGEYTEIVLILPEVREKNDKGIDC